jgi:hypothetical protein
MARAKVVAKAKTGATVRKKPVKAGSTHTSTTGGIMTTKVIAIAKKKKGYKHNG